VENRILRTLKDRGFPNNKTVFGTDQFKNIPFDIIAEIKMVSIGVPVAAFVGDPQNWTLLGTDSFAIKHQGELNFLKIDSIVSAHISDHPETPKNKCESIRLTDDTNAQYIMRSPPGGPCLALLGLLNILQKLKPKT